MNLSKKIRVAVLFGGKSAEHEVSLQSAKNVIEAIDVAFPVLHGTYGEDGSIQGMLKLADIPYVGAGILGSAVGMDKDVLKRLLRDAKIPVAKFLVAQAGDKKPVSFATTKKALG